MNNFRISLLKNLELTFIYVFQRLPSMRIFLKQRPNWETI